MRLVVKSQRFKELFTLSGKVGLCMEASLHGDSRAVSLLVFLVSNFVTMFEE